jgi:putative peptidoglycan lipid II flippase
LAFNTAIVGGAFVLSRVLGLVREAVIAAQFGTSREYDAYQLAFGIPDTLFLLIVGGAVGSAFIPVFTRLMSQQRERQAWQLASTLVNGSVVLLSLGGILMTAAAPWLVGWVIAPGRPPDQQGLVVDLTRVLLISVVFLGLGGWAMGILNARRQFALPALAPIAYNLAIIGGALFLVPYIGVFGLAWGVVAGAFLHFAVQAPGLRRVGMVYSPFRIALGDEGVGRVSRLLVPRVMGQAAFQANIIAMRSIASFLSAGRIAAFSYAYLLMLLPHGVFAMSLATVIFPTMAAQHADGNLDGMRTTLARATRVLIFLALPSAAGLLVLRYEIVATLFQFGAFTSASTQLVAPALGYFALGLVAYAVVEVLTRAFYALHDTATPVTISVATVLLNLGLSLALTRGYGWEHEGLALSLSITTSVEMVLMWVLLGRKLPGWRLSSDGMLPSLLKSSAAALAMGVALQLALPVLRAALPGASSDKPAAIALTAAGIALGGLVYLGAARLLRSQELDDALGLLLSRLGRR